MKLICCFYADFKCRSIRSCITLRLFKIRKLGEIIFSEKTGVALSKMSGTFCFVWRGLGRWIVRQTLYHISPPPLPSSQLSLSLSLLLYNMGGVDFFDVLLDLCPHYETILLYHAR